MSDENIAQPQAAAQQPVQTQQSTQPIGEPHFIPPPQFKVPGPVMQEPQGQIGIQSGNTSDNPAPFVQAPGKEPNPSAGRLEPLPDK